MGNGGIDPPFLTSVLNGGESSAYLPRVNHSSTDWIGGWVGPRAGMDTVEQRNIHFMPCNAFPLIVVPYGCSSDINIACGVADCAEGVIRIFLFIMVRCVHKH
jgi:hypothetical protein